MKNSWPPKVGAFVLVIGVVLFVYASWPERNQHETLNLNPVELSISYQGSNIIFYSQPVLQLEIPVRLKLGESGIMRLVFWQKEVPSNLRALESFNVVVEARLEYPGLNVIPFERIQEVYKPGQELFFHWSIQAARSLEYPGTLRVYLVFIPKQGGEVISQPILAKQVKVTVRSISGRVISWFRWGGIGLIAVAIVLFVMGSKNKRHINSSLICDKIYKR